MKSFLLFLLAFKLSTSFATAYPSAPATVARWSRYEIVLQGPRDGNPFADQWVRAEFSLGGRTVTASGFYDGDGVYRIRFMPDSMGEWHYRTLSNSKLLRGKTGSFTCVSPEPGNHGPVKVAATTHFKYADGKWFYPFGTTLYAWTHQGASLQEQTLQTLAGAGFNKVRMCVFPKYYSYVEEEPALYPYERLPQEKTGGSAAERWDLTRFNPAFFRHLEKRIDDLAAMGIEADLIIFHPYDKGHWGFDSLGEAADLRYLQYLTSRLSSFHNVWWSMANEFDFIKSKPRAVWDVYTKAVIDNDPYGHLRSIHNGYVYYDLWKPLFTHASIQNGSAVEDFGRAVLLKNALFKPVIYDEVCYEGNIPQRWGRLSGEEMTHAFWQGIIAGTYVTHGETFLDHSGDTVFWAKGGRLRGSSPARIAFLRKLMEEGPGPLEQADMWKDYQTSQADTNYYLIYFGKEMQREWTFSLPRRNAPAAGAKFRVDVIDTWNMTVTPVKDTFEITKPDGSRVYDKQLKKILLPTQPWMALRITRVAGK